jgi:preprotein translocase subunit SecE
MKSPKEKSMGYTIAVIIAAIIIFVVIGAISQVFMRI